MLVVGWGLQYAIDTKDKPLVTPIPEHDDRLQCVNVTIINNNECTKYFGRPIPSTILCSYSKGRDACQVVPFLFLFWLNDKLINVKGDSGGPMLCNNLQIGIVSSGIGCAYKKYPGLYTNLAKFRDFISRASENFTYNLAACRFQRVAFTFCVILIFAIASLI